MRKELLPQTYIFASELSAQSGDGRTVAPKCSFARCCLVRCSCARGDCCPGLRYVVRRAANARGDCFISSRDVVRRAVHARGVIVALVRKTWFCTLFMHAWVIVTLVRATWFCAPLMRAGRLIPISQSQSAWHTPGADVRFGTSRHSSGSPTPAASARATAPTARRSPAP